MLAIAELHRFQNRSRDTFLLPTKVAIHQAAYCDVAGVHAGQRVVHQDVNVERRHFSGLANCPESLTQIVGPFRQDSALLLLFDQMTF
jgi:hypothetical protein